LRWHFDAFAQRRTDEHRSAITQAWTTAVVGRMKRIPPLKRILPPKWRHRLTPEEKQQLREEIAELQRPRR
jgi:hypothetical protein